MDPVANHFVHASAAARYERHRPFFHPHVMALIRERLQLTAPLPCALDVGCGPGPSAVALREIAAQVTATDISPAMLASAPAAEGVTYVCAPAESLPFPAASFPLLTVSMAFHWFDRSRFLAEAARVLAPGGWLVLYGYHHTHQLAGVPEFTIWFESVFQYRYPQTPRHGSPVGADDLASHRLALVDRSTFAEVRRYTTAGFTSYLMTHSNVIRRVEGGNESADTAEAWIRTELTRFLPADASGEFGFSGWVSWIQKPDTQTG
jgi:ubiquinone/menaquinone biosynthesis C-methylase UbiE